MVTAGDEQRGARRERSEDRYRSCTRRQSRVPPRTPSVQKCTKGPKEWQSERKGDVYCLKPPESLGMESEWSRNPMTRLGIEPRTYGLKVRCSTN